MAKKKKKYSKKQKDVLGLVSGLAWLQSGGGIFKGMAPITQTGGKATIIDTVPKGGYGKGHEPKAQFARLSDGSKLMLRGPKKGMIIK